MERGGGIEEEEGDGEWGKALSQVP